MNWTAVWIETGVWCLLFTALILVINTFREKYPSFAELNYPPQIVERLISLGRIQAQKPLQLAKRLAKKLPILICYVVLFTLILYFVNGARTFLSGFLSCFIIMSVWDWYDAFFLDCVLFCNTKLFVMKGTEDMKEAYHDYWFHIKGSLKGMVLVTAGSLVIGGIIALLGLI